MLRVVNQWFHRYFSDPQAVFLLVFLLATVAIIMTMGRMLAPLLASIIIAYLLEGVVKNLVHWHFPRRLAVLIVFMAFIALLTFLLLFLLPLLSYQISQFFQELPNMIGGWQNKLMELPDDYPNFISGEQIQSLMNTIRSSARTLGQLVLSYSLASIPVIVTLIIYLILVPLMVFFFLIDKEKILDWLVGFLPKERAVAQRVWEEMDLQIGNYVRGKFYETFIVGIVTYIAFYWLNLNYASLLAVLVGLSVIVPYVGAVAVTFPVIIVAFFQWGWGSEFFWIVSIYFIIQALDGNILVPLLFSEAINLHPVAIIVAVLVFGGLWGFWGVFFAIPLAALVKALINAWPRSELHHQLPPPIIL
ncbi:AI-2E family transporter [Thioflexithrix psekupsensis]|uniref:AI-2E family transporter n=1 Tax=Thioflexithrix psekupsensis TaxID=1570016 RepID=A0A251XBW9_9GAMM|nr:AI-2E family transporter [Thioflexithrix psekupsensis]OUD15546.1 AI-2E family transporter [Thioflexithrix psekupsensis]